MQVVASGATQARTTSTKNVGMGIWDGHATAQELAKLEKVLTCGITRHENDVSAASTIMLYFFYHFSYYYYYDCVTTKRTAITP